MLFGLSIALNSFSQTSSPLGTWNALGVPSYLTTSDVITAYDMSMITGVLPESVNNSSKVDVNQFANLNLVDTTQVWVTFVNEGACWTNALGFYTYTTGSPPVTIGDISNKTIIFPNVSDVAQNCSYQGSPGLSSGMKVYIGEFPSNTTIGWYLVAQGWKTSGAQVTNTYHTHYSNHNLNDAVLQANKPQNVFFYSTSLNKYILGFEDYMRPNGDNDFNDCIFYVTTIIKETGEPLPPPVGIPEIDEGGVNLSVRFLNFYGQKLNNHVVLKWTTATEENNEYFEIEASVDAIHFSAIGRVPGSNTSNTLKNYSFLDNKIHSYYRIKQVDFDGKFSYSKTISVVDSESDAPISISVFPNPSSQQFIMLQTQGFVGKTKLEIINSIGECVLVQNFENSQSKELYELNICELVDGVYIIKYADSYNQSTLRFIKCTSGR